MPFVCMAYDMAARPRPGTRASTVDRPAPRGNRRGFRRERAVERRSVGGAAPPVNECDVVVPGANARRTGPCRGPSRKWIVDRPRCPGEHRAFGVRRTKRMIPFPRSRREVTPLSPRVEELLGGVARRSAPEGTLERILALHASGSVYAGENEPRGLLLRLPFADVARFAIPATAAAAAVMAFGLPTSSAPAARPTVPLAMVRHADVPESNADLRVVNDPTLASYELRYVAGDAP